MNIKEMHYDFKQKLNKIDSQQYRNLRVPEIDWKINEACEIFIKSIAEPRINNHLGFEVNQRTIDDIRTIVINDKVLTATQIDDTSYFVTLPEDYMFYISANIIMSKGTCKDKIGRAILRQHDDRFETSPFDNSSFEWGEVNIRFYDKGIRVFTDGTFSIKELRLNYIRKHAYIHNAQDFLPTGSYTLPSGQVLTGIQNCELPEHTHREIVDIAVLITSGDLSMADYQLKQAKINLNQIN
jgi:hypothetical protein